MTIFINHSNLSSINFTFIVSYLKLFWVLNWIQARRPDIVVKDKELDHTWIIDIAVPGDARVEDKEKEKVEKYQDLARELRRLWETSVNVIPVVVGALGAVAKLEEYLGMIKIQQKEVDRIQFSALLGTATILRKVLDVSG